MLEHLLGAMHWVLGVTAAGPVHLLGKECELWQPGHLVMDSPGKSPQGDGKLPSDGGGGYRFGVPKSWRSGQMSQDEPRLPS